MAEDSIPADVRDFIEKNIDSIASLEALLLLRNDAVRSWTPASVAARLYIAENDAEAILQRLTSSGFFKSADDAFRYAADPTLDEMAGRLAGLYSRHLIPITNLIHSRSGRIRAFASAFKLRKES
jgi:Arc/MetJ-type ribon-helix-helix transcriptional regulator